MANQIVVSAGAKVRNLNGVLTGTSGVVSSVPLGGANGVATLDSGGKVPVSQLPSSVVTYLGTWNAATNTPTLVNGTGDAGDMYICNVAGTVDFGAGPIPFAVGDWVLYGSGTWEKSNGQNGTVTSVAASITGNAVGLTGSPITTAGTLAFAFAGTNLQYVNGAGNLTTFPTLITSIGLSMPSAFSVANSPLTANGTIAVTGAGTTAQYIRGDGSLATFPTIATEAQRLITEVYNETGATLTKGTVVYINGGHGNLPTITKALATGDATSAQTYGIVQTDITNNNNGYVVVIGSLTDLDTSAYVEGTQLYLSSTTAGAWTSVKQYAPAHLVYVAIVTRSHPTQGVVEVRIQNGFEMDELHNVSAQSPLNNQGLFYNTSTSLWENKSIATALGYTPADDSLVVKLAGTQTITGAKTFSGGVTFSSSVTTNNLTFANSGFFLTLQPPTLGVNRTVTLPNATGTLALTSDISYPVTSVFGRTGAVVATSGDYTTAQVTEVTNLYYTDTRARLALSFAAGSGAYNSTTGVITIPTNNNQITNGAGYITGNQTITLSGDVSGSGTTAITTTIGALKVTNAMLAGSIDLTTKVTGLLPDGNISSAATWNAKQNAITLTTTGTSGAATLVGATLNIPQYTDAYTGTVTSVAALTLGTTGTDLSSSVANSTTTPVITLNVPTASATNRGALASADWAIFNGKQAQLNGTGFVKATGTTISYDNTNYLPLTGGTLTGALSGTSGTFTQLGAGVTPINLFSVRTGTNNIFDIYDNGTGPAIQSVNDNVTLYRPLFFFATAFTFSNSVTATSFVKTSGTSSQFLKADGSVDSTAYGTGSVTSVGLSSATSGVTIGSSPITTSGTITLAIATATTSQNGLLSSTDWTTFNNKQDALTNPVTGTGTTNYLPKFTGTSTIGNSAIFDNSGNIGIGTISANAIFEIGGLVVDVTKTVFRSSLAVAPTAYYNDITAIYSGASAAANKFIINYANGYTSGTGIVLQGDGNVGIGISASLARLHILAPTNDIVLRFQQQNDPTSQYYFNIDSAVNGALSLVTNYLGGTAIGFSQSRAANVSIGTTTDSGYKLDVNGTGRFSGILEINAGAGGTDWLRLIRTGVVEWAFNANEGALNFVNNTGSINALKLASTGAATFSNALQVAGQQAAANYGGTGLNFDFTSGNIGRIASVKTTSGGSQLQFLVYNTSGTDVNALSIASTGAATFSSSVTATTGNGNSLNLRSGNAGQYTIFGLGRTAQDLAIASAATSGQFFVGAVAGDAWFGSTNGTIGLGNDTSGIATMVIKGGNVLIGTTTDAGNKLDVASTPTFSASGNTTILSTTNLSVAAGATFNTGGIWAASRQINLITWNGSVSTTMDNGAVIAGQVAVNRHSFGAAGYTINPSQSGSNIRALAGLQVLQQTGGSYSGTITYGASMFIQGIYPTSAANVTFTNYYGLLINNLDEWGGVTLTNRWGIYQAGSSDANYLAGKLQVGSATAVSGSYKAEITGILYASSGLKTGNPTGDTAQTWKLGSAYSGTVTHTHYVNVEINGTTYSLLASNVA